MRVTLHRDISGAAGSFSAGQVADLPDAMAKGLVEAGHATADVIADAPAIPEAAVIQAPETAARRSPKPAKGRK